MPDFAQLLYEIIPDNNLHARWLNTLSMMENAGARKISASESKTGVTLMVLKHAAEEARHAFILKKQIERIGAIDFPDYSREYVLGGYDSIYYLHQLDIAISRYLKRELNLGGEELKFAAYLLVTYAIEVRADELYPVYQTALTWHGSRVNVKSIIAEEETHLAEMHSQMESFFGDLKPHADFASAIETKLFNSWVEKLTASVKESVAVES